ncbi:hypothetical protein VNO77_24755 [Canavalia gladiata]|uniref:Uncharacterized protein n=1 Tax=Canavalia gladiata TaxID=3824 RepID=A0AAN9QA97_CANGL
MTPVLVRIIVKELYRSVFVGKTHSFMIYHSLEGKTGFIGEVGSFEPYRIRPSTFIRMILDSGLFEPYVPVSYEILRLQQARDSSAVEGILVWDNRIQSQGMDQVCYAST